MPYDVLQYDVMQLRVCCQLRFFSQHHISPSLPLPSLHFSHLHFFSFFLLLYSSLFFSPVEDSSFGGLHGVAHDTECTFEGCECFFAGSQSLSDLKVMGDMFLKLHWKISEWKI